MSKICTIEKCGIEIHAKGLCNIHYRRKLKFGNPLYERIKELKKCSIDGCGKKHYGLGLCKRHHHLRWVRNNPIRKKESAKKYYYSEKGQKTTKQWSFDNREKMMEYQKSVPKNIKSSWMKKYKDSHQELCKFRNAKKRINVLASRGLTFEVSFERFSEILHQPCNYCGSNHVIGSVDRIDSSIGYVEGNIQPLCLRCNLMKLTDSHVDFISHINKIHQHLNKKGD